MRFELGALAAIIVLLNLPLLHGTCAVDMIFLPDRVAAGEWWRVFTHWFVHVSWYHLLLDATAFLMLYQGLVGRSAFERIGYVLVCGAGSLLASFWCSPIIQTRGLCGLSGIAHGLMAITSLDQMTGSRDKTLRRAGAVTFIIVITKSIFEAVTGRIVFENLHFGALGSPVAVCHAGGVLAGLGAWAIAQWLRTRLASRTMPAWRCVIRSRHRAAVCAGDVQPAGRQGAAPTRRGRPLAAQSGCRDYGRTRVRRGRQ